MRGLPEVLCALVKPGPQDGGDGTEKEKGRVTAPSWLWGLKKGPGHHGLTQEHPRGLGVNREFTPKFLAMSMKLKLWKTSWLHFIVSSGGCRAGERL